MGRWSLSLWSRSYMSDFVHVICTRIFFTYLYIIFLLWIITCKYDISVGWCRKTYPHHYETGNPAIFLDTSRSVISSPRQGEVEYNDVICCFPTGSRPHRVHVPYIYIHLVDFYGKLVGWFLPYMHPMGQSKHTNMWKSQLTRWLRLSYCTMIYIFLMIWIMDRLKVSLNCMPENDLDCDVKTIWRSDFGTRGRFLGKTFGNPIGALFFGV